MASGTDGVDLFAGPIIQALRGFGIEVTPMKKTCRDFFEFIAQDSQLPAEGAVQQRLFQRRQRCLLLLVVAREALGFGGKGL